MGTEPYLPPTAPGPRLMLPANEQGYEFVSDEEALAAIQGTGLEQYVTDNAFTQTMNPNMLPGTASTDEDYNTKTLDTIKGTYDPLYDPTPGDGVYSETDLTTIKGQIAQDGTTDPNDPTPLTILTADDKAAMQKNIDPTLPPSDVAQGIEYTDLSGNTRITQGGVGGALEVVPGSDPPVYYDNPAAGGSGGYYDVQSTVSMDPNSILMGKKILIMMFNNVTSGLSKQDRERYENESEEYSRMVEEWMESEQRDEALAAQMKQEAAMGEQRASQRRKDEEKASEKKAS